MVWVTAEVEIDLADFSTEDLVRELNNRSDNPFSDVLDLDDLYNALQAKDTDRALKLATDLAQTFTGRIVTS